MSKANIPGILQLISSRTMYGAEKVVMNLAAGLAKRGHHVVVANLLEGRPVPGGITEHAREQNLETSEIRCRGRLDLSALEQLRRLLLERRITIVHSHGYKSNFYALLACNGSPARTVATCHNWPGSSVKMRLYRWLDKRILRGFDRVVVVSEALRSELSLRSGRAPLLLPNGINASAMRSNRREAIREVWGILPDEKVVGTVGRLSSEKGHELLLRAAAGLHGRLPGIKTVIVGDGPLLERLRHLGDGPGLSGRVVFAGRREDIPDVLSAFDVFALPSLTEGLPMALLEAMAARKPVIASRVGEIPHIIEDGLSGVLVSAGDAGKLETALEKVLGDDVFAGRCAEAGYETVRSRFSMERMVESYELVYRHLWGGSGYAA